MKGSPALMGAKATNDFTTQRGELSERKGRLTQVRGRLQNILKDEKFMKKNRLELPYGFAFHHLGEE